MKDEGDKAFGLTCAELARKNSIFGFLCDFAESFEFRQRH